ncbi:hypothetical protein V6N13_053756 [Hibiscus sabdariffa]
MDHGFITKDEEKKGDEGQDVDETEDGDMIESYYCFVLSLKDFTRSKMGIFSKINMVAMVKLMGKIEFFFSFLKDHIREVERWKWGEGQKETTTTSSIKMIVEGDNNKFSRGLQGKAENSSIRRLSRDHIYTLCVENIPKAMQWKGLWHAFERDGDVIEAYIARKLSISGRKFGFVRFKSRDDATRAIDRLNGFTLYVMVGDEYKNQEKGAKRALGHVDEDLWKMKKCLVKEMSTVCAVTSIMERLSSRGLGEIKVQRMGEIFTKVEPWSEKMTIPARATWLELTGVPLHCWNHVTIRRIAELWGHFEAFGENYGVCYKSRRAWVQREDDVRSEKHKEKTSESGKLIQKEESRSDSKSVTEETKSRPPDPSGSSQEEQWETVNVSYKGKDCMGNENFTIFDSKVAEFNQHLGEEEMQSLPMSHPTWAEVVANNNRGQCLDIDLVQPQDQYQAREVGVGQLPGSRFAMPVISSAQDPSQVADAGICQQSGLSDPNQAPEPLYNNMEMDSPLVVSSQSLS